MARPLSLAFRQSTFTQETGEAFLSICSISHPSILNGPLRVVNDLQDITSVSNVYTAFPFQVILPSDGVDERPRVKLSLDNIDRSIVIAIRSIPPGDPPMVQIDIVLASQPDVIDISFPGLTLRNVEYDQFVIEGDLVLDEDDREPIPWQTFSPQLAPGLF